MVAAVCSGLDRGVVQFIWIRVEIERQSLVFLSSYGAGIEKSEEMEYFSN